MKNYNYHAKAKKFFRIFRASGGDLSENISPELKKEMTKPWPDMVEDATYALSLMLESRGVFDAGSPRVPTEADPRANAKSGSSEWIDEMTDTFVGEGIPPQEALFRVLKANYLAIESLKKFQSLSEEESERALEFLTSDGQRDNEILKGLFTSDTP